MASYIRRVNLSVKPPLQITRFEKRSSSAILQHAERYAVIALMCFVALASLVAVFSTGSNILVHLSKLDTLLISGMLILSLTSYGLRTTRWLLLSRALDIQVPLSVNSLYYVAGFSMGVTPGKLGEFLRIWLLKRGHGYRYERSLSLLVADRLSDVFAIALICLVGVSIFSHYALPVAFFYPLAINCGRHFSTSCLWARHNKPRLCYYRALA